MFILIFIYNCVNPSQHEILFTVQNIIMPSQHRVSEVTKNPSVFKTN